MSVYLPFTGHPVFAWLLCNSRLMVSLGVFTTLCLPAEAAALLFDIEAFTTGLSTAVDISRFNTGNALAPGVYRVDVFLNGQSAGRREISFVSRDDKDNVQPCVSALELAQLGVVLPPDERSADTQCREFTQWIPLASSQLDIVTLTLDVNIPQAYLSRAARGYVDPARWDKGLDVALLNYTFSAAAVTSGAG
ncbi:fimbrial biogenesis outer membrane usher protein, partial [Pseudomonas lactis]